MPRSEFAALTVHAKINRAGSGSHQREQNVLPGTLAYPMPHDSQELAFEAPMPLFALPAGPLRVKRHVRVCVRVCTQSDACNL